MLHLQYNAVMLLMLLLMSILNIIFALSILLVL